MSEKNFASYGDMETLVTEIVDKCGPDSFYGTCSTAASTAAKVVTLVNANNLSLRPGVTVTVKFSATNTAQNPTINVNGTGAKSVWYNAAVVTASSLAIAGVANIPIRYTYDGTYWVFMGWSADNNTTYSAMSTAELTTGTATKQRTVRADYLKAGINSLIDTKVDDLYTEIAYEDWLKLTPYQQEHGRWDVTGVPGADGTISIDLMTKLWENPDPTQSIAADTEFNINTAGYDLVMFVIAYSTAYLQYKSSVIVPQGTTASLFQFNSSGTGWVARAFNYVSDTKYKAGAGYNAGTTSTAAAIPLVAYGIKLRHTVEIVAIAPTLSTLAKNSVFDPTGTDLESTNVEDAIKELETNFQAGVDAVYDAVVAKGSTPASHSLSDIIAAIAAIPSGITPSGTYTYPSGSTGGTVDVTNYAKVNAQNVYAKGKADGDVKHTVTVKNDGSRDTAITVSKDGTAISTAMYDPGYSRSFTI